MKRALVLLVGIAMLLSGGGFAVLAVLGTGDEPGSAPRTDVPTTVPDPGATEPPSAGLAEFYSQTLAWSVCPDDEALCASLTVPLDYEHPDGETIDIAVLKVPARDADLRVGSLVVNPGGPGAPGTGYAASAARVFRDPLLDVYDVVGFDPRGTGGSAPVDCLTDEQLDAYVAEDPSPDDDAEIAEYERWVEDLGRGCAERSGELAAHVTTVEAARDMDVLRAALGESTMTYFGASYGTKLGATYADLFPDRVGRLVLDGAVDLSLEPRELSLEQAAGFETALRAYVTDCVEKSAGCFLGDSVDESITRIEQLLESIDRQPLDTVTDRDLEVGNAAYGIVMPLYNRDFWPYLDQGLQAALKDDGSVLLQLSDVYNSRGPDGYTDNSVEANYAINCLDDPWSLPAAEVPAAVPDFERASPTFGRVFAWGLTTCGGVQVRATEPQPEVEAQGAAPIVVIGTTRDPATPYDWAVQLAEQLASGVLVSRDGDGHTGYNSGNQCVDEAVEDYLVDGSVPEDGLSC